MSKPPYPPASSRSDSVEGFDLRTALARAVGTADRYATNRIRGLPGPDPMSVILQVTDGQQATCLVTPGRLNQPVLIPADVLPTRQLPSPVTIQRAHGNWQSSEGKLAPEINPDSATTTAFPTISDVLPTTPGPGPGPGHTPGPGIAPETSAGPIAVAIDLMTLKKIADAMGTTKLTLLIQPPSQPAPPPSTGNGQGRETNSCVTRPIAVCPAAENTPAEGIAVFMPIRPQHTHSYYNNLRSIVAQAEHQATRIAPRPRRKQVA